jgi:hypothetical protein
VKDSVLPLQTYTSAAKAATYKDFRAKSKATATSKPPAYKAGGRHQFKSNVKGAQLKLAATTSKT